MYWRMSALSSAIRTRGRASFACSAGARRGISSEAAARVSADAYARSGVLINAVTPGPIDTDLWLAPGGLADQLARQRGVSREEVLAMQRGKLPLGRHGTADEIADVIVFLCSERASNVSGAAWSAAGGAVPVII